MKHALRLYASGAAPTKKAAAEAAGLKPVTMYIATSPTLGETHNTRFMQELDSDIQTKAIDVGVLLDKLSVEAVHTIHHIRNNGSSEALRLKAAMDLADRGSRTGKIQKHQVESFTLTGRDVEALSAAMLESKHVSALHEEVQGNFEKVVGGDRDAGNENHSRHRDWCAWCRVLAGSDG